MEKDNLSWREKEMNLKNDITDVFRRSSTIDDSRIAWLEKEMQKHMQERNMIEGKLEEASREPGILKSSCCWLLFSPLKMCITV